MVDVQLVSYLRENIGKGYSKEQLREILTKSGWHPHDLDDAFAALEKPVEPKLPELPEAPKPMPAAPAPPANAQPKPAAPQTPKGAEQFYVEPKAKKTNWKDIVIIIGMVLALCGVAYTIYIMFIA